MKKLLVISLPIIVIMMICISGCTSEPAVSASPCDECYKEIYEKTSIVRIDKNGPFEVSSDGVRLHVIDCDGVSYNTLHIASIMSDLDQYDGGNVTFTYSCHKNGYYQIHTIRHTCEPKPIDPCDKPIPTCKCITPTPTPTCGCAK